jgi:6-pyruvoyltetrahydropterin/6-carboxytetrahydropterin synthase
MVELTRTVRFSVNDGTASLSGPSLNSFAADPSMTGLGRHYELELRCRGEVDPATGYCINIKDIDRAVRSKAIPIIAAACARGPCQHPANVLQEAIGALDHEFRGGVATASLRWRLSPYYSIEMLPLTPTIALLRQQFDFAAAHRLHVSSLSDEENRRIFGKCNNLRGHGHNYRVEPCVEVPVEQAGPPALTLAEFEQLTVKHIIARFDHTHLNEDTVEFNTARGGMNPSVENIARVCFEILSPAIQAAAPRAKLRCVTVWETDKTSSTFPG